VRAAPDVRFVLAGRGVVAENAALSGCIKEEGLAGKVFLLGERRDVASLLPAFDLYCSSSTNEAFPAVVAEAMSSGVPCVVTDVGASKELVDGLGLAVPPGDADGLAAALVAMLALPPDQRVSIGQRGRQRVIERYSVESFVGGYERLYHDILGGATRETRRGWVGGATIPCS
jgi:glycosyltransferase involved in cell wall biosynthesis